MAEIFIAGGTGYLGRPLAAELVRRDHRVRILARNGSEDRVATGTRVVLGDALNPNSYASAVLGCGTFVHLVGVSHPSPWKAEEFRRVDLASTRASIQAAVAARVRHFVYISVAHPAPMMRAYIAVRSECEQMIRNSGLNAMILRPWYVLGPGHRWPYALLPFYWLAEHTSKWRESALRLGLVAHAQMVRALVNVVENPAVGVRFIEVPEIRKLAGILPIRESVALNER